MKRYERDNADDIEDRRHGDGCSYGYSDAVAWVKRTRPDTRLPQSRASGQEQ